MTPQELKNSILQLAIQGKLVEQRAEEGTGKELLEKILAAKNAEGAKGRGNKLTHIPRAKRVCEADALSGVSRGVRGGCEEAGISNLPKAAKFQPSNTLSALTASPREEIPDDEKPFDIPESWEWVRHNALFEIVGGSQPSKSKFRDKPQEGYVRLYQIRDYGEKPVPVYVPTKMVSKFTQKGDILLARYGASLGKIFWAEKGAYNVAMAKVVRLYEGGMVDNKYLYYYYRAPLYQTFIKGNTRSAQAGFNKEDLNNLVFPLPPLAEQKRIVAKIEELMLLVERYEKAWSKLKDFNMRFPVDMQKSLLQMAIQGKLVEQRADEGTGRELLEEILAAKNAESAKGRGGKSHAKSAKSAKAGSCVSREEIPDDEKPFDIPESWEWVRWGDLSQSIQYGYNASAKKAGRIKMVRISDIQGGQVLWDTVPYCEINEKDIETYLLQENDILFARTGGTVGKSFLVKDLPVDAVYAGYLIRTRYSSELSPEYMKYFMESPLYWEQLKNGTIATAQPNCNGKTLARMLLPLPPLAEQKRIVAKLEELLPLCERLK